RAPPPHPLARPPGRNGAGYEQFRRTAGEPADPQPRRLSPQRDPAALCGGGLMRLLLIVLLLTTGTAIAQEEKVVLKDAPGRDKAMQCLACHSLDYIQMNSRFL